MAELGACNGGIGKGSAAARLATVCCTRIAIIRAHAPNARDRPTADLRRAGLTDGSAA
jgi:hypothetical protein